MEYFNNELCVTYEELTSGDDPVIKYQTLRKNITRGRIRTAQRGGGEGSCALIIYSSLPEKYKVRFVEREKSLSSSGFICNFGFQLIVGVFYALFLRVMKQVGDYCFQGSANPLEFHDRRN